MYILYSKSAITQKLVRKTIAFYKSFIKNHIRKFCTAELLLITVGVFVSDFLIPGHNYEDYLHTYV